MKYKFYFFSLLAYASLNIGHPVTPAFLKLIDLPDYFFGYLFVIMSLANVIFSPIWGKLGDKYGRNLLMFIGLTGYGLGQILLVLTNNIIIILLARFISGALIASFIVNFYAYIIENTNEDRVTVLSIVGGLSAISVSIGYYLGGLVGEYVGIIETFYIQAIYCFILSFIVIFTFKSKILIKKDRLSFFKSIKSITNIENKNTLYMLIILFFATIAFTNVSKYLDVVLVNNFNYSTKDLGFFVFITGIISLITAYLIVKPLSRIFSEVFLIRYSLLLCGIFLLITFLNNNDDITQSIYTYFMIFVVFKTFFEPLNIAYLSKDDTISQGILIGLRKSFQSLGSITTIIFGYIYNYNVYVLFYICAIILIFTSILTFIIKERGDYSESVRK